MFLFEKYEQLVMDAARSELLPVAPYHIMVILSQLLLFVGVLVIGANTIHSNSQVHLIGFHLLHLLN
jgi:hypothetical protein